MNILRSLLGHSGSAERVEPNLSPEILERYRKLSPAERRRLLRKAEQSAASSLSVDPGRDFAAERDASIELELMGFYGQVAANIRAEFRNPGDRKLHWEVAVGQDDPPDGLWGWMILEAHVWPPVLITRAPVAFATRDAAQEAGETEADASWVALNSQLATW